MIVKMQPMTRKKWKQLFAGLLAACVAVWVAAAVRKSLNGLSRLSHIVCNLPLQSGPMSYRDLEVLSPTSVLIFQNDVNQAQKSYRSWIYNLDTVTGMVTENRALEKETKNVEFSTPRLASDGSFLLVKSLFPRAPQGLNVTAITPAGTVIKRWNIGGSDSALLEGQAYVEFGGGFVPLDSQHGWLEYAAKGDVSNGKSLMHTLHGADSANISECVIDRGEHILGLDNQGHLIGFRGNSYRFGSKDNEIHKFDANNVNRKVSTNTLPIDPIQLDDGGILIKSPRNIELYRNSNRLLYVVEYGGEPIYPKFMRKWSTMFREAVGPVRSELWIADTDGHNARLLAYPDLYIQPDTVKWAQDGKSILFVSGNQLRRIAVN